MVRVPPIRNRPEALAFGFAARPTTSAYRRTGQPRRRASAWGVAPATHLPRLDPAGSARLNPVRIG